MVKIEYDSEADAIYIWIREAKYKISEELAKNVIVDLDKRGRLIGFEVLDVSKTLGKKLVNKIVDSEKVASA